MAKQTPLAFTTFEGSTTVATVKRHSQVAKTHGMPDPYPKVLHILGHPRFEELAVVTRLIHQSGGLMTVDDLAYQGDTSAGILMEYYTRLMHSVERSINQGVKPRHQITGFHILAAEGVVIESELFPHKTMLELPPLEHIDGLSTFERGVNSMLDQYDRSGFLERY